MNAQLIYEKGYSGKRHSTGESLAIICASVLTEKISGKRADTKEER